MGSRVQVSCYLGAVDFYAIAHNLLNESGNHD